MTISTPGVKIEILVDEPLRKRIRVASEEAGLSGYSFHPLLGGSGKNGRWMADQVTGGAGAKGVFTTVVTEEEAQRFLEKLSPLIDEYGLVITTTDVKTIRRKPDAG